MRVRKEEEIQSGISKGLKGHSVYNMFFSTIPETKLFKPFIVFRMLRISKVKETGIPTHIWGEDSMGYYFPLLIRIGTHCRVC